MPKAPDDKAPRSKGGTGQDLNHTFLVKVAPYANGLAVGLGIKVLDTGLKKRLASASELKAFSSLVAGRVDKALSDAGIGSGADGTAVSEAVEAFVKAASHGETSMFARKIGNGDEPEPGEDGRLVYVLNPDEKAMHEVIPTAPNSSRVWFHFVEKDELLVQVIAPKPGKPGVNVRGEEIQPPKPKEPKLSSIQGPRTRMEGDKLLADSDGCYQEDAQGRVRVLPEVTVKQVDASTGSFPDTGATKANVLVEKSIKSGYGVTSVGNVFVGRSKDASVEKNAHVVAKNLIVFGGIRGNGWAKGPQGDAVVDVQELVAVSHVGGGVIQAGRILVTGESRQGVLDSDSAVFVAENLIGGRTSVRTKLEVGGNIGTKEGGSRTRIILPVDAPTRKKKRVDRARHEVQTSLAESETTLQTLDSKAQKRAEIDSYWSALLADDFREPTRPIEANTLRQFKDWENERRVTERKISEAKKYRVALESESEEEEEKTGSLEAVIRCAGQIHLDVTIEAYREKDEEDLEAAISFKSGNQTFAKSTLMELRTSLQQEVRAYQDQIGSQIAERQEALEKMFEGTDRRPTGPEVPDKTFTLPFVWLDESGSEVTVPEGLRVETTGSVSVKEPKTLVVHTQASVSSPLAQSQISVSEEEARLKFEVSQMNEANLTWKFDFDLTGLLDGIGIRGVTGLAFLNGKAGPIEENEGWEAPREEEVEDDSDSPSSG